MKQNTRFKPGVSGNETAKWRPGQSGNPAGKSKRRAQFDEEFNEALIAEGSAEEAARPLVAGGTKPGTVGDPGVVPAVCPTDTVLANDPRGGTWQIRLHQTHRRTDRAALPNHGGWKS